MNDAMILYEPSRDHDLVLARWWTTLISGDDASRTFSPDVTSNLHAFLSFFQLPRHLVFKLDGGGVWFAAWYEPIMSGAFFGLWIREDHRQSRASFVAFEESIRAGLVVSPVLIGVTRQPDLIDEHERVGYTLVGRIPELWDGDDVWILTMTRESFNARNTQPIVPVEVL